MITSRIWLGAAIVLLLAIPAPAEILPTQGTFRGIYHENRAGVGRISFFLVPKDVRKELASYDGKYIEFEVLAGRQPMNPGPAVISKLGKVHVLEPDPLKMEITAIAPGSAGPDTFDLLYRFRNVTQETVTLDANLVAIGLLSDGDTGTHSNESDFFGCGYTFKQLAYDGDVLQRWNFISPMEPGRSTHFYVGGVALEPGEEAPFIWHGLPNKPGKIEVMVSASCSTSAEQRRPLMAWKQLDLPVPLGNATDDGLKIQAKVTRDGDWLSVDGRLINETGKPRYVFVAPRSEERVFLSGLIMLQDKAGNQLRTDIDGPEALGPWKQTEVDHIGLNFQFRVRHSDRFSQTPEERLGLLILTRSGIQKLNVAKSLPAREERFEPQWGPISKGARLDIRSAKGSFASREPIRLLCRAECDPKSADILMIDEGMFRTNVVVEIDGNPAHIAWHGLSDGHVHAFPLQADIELAVMDLKPGKHTIRLTVRGDPGVYINLRGVPLRRYSGTLVSKEADFVVREK